MERRFFYITQDSLVVWTASRSTLTEQTTFANTDDGLRAFAVYLEHSSQQLSMMVVDVIEEEFVTDAIPKLSAGDRKGLIARRLGKRFARTPYRLGIYQGPSARGNDDYAVLYTAITNHELLDPWLDVIARYKTPLLGIYSVPHMGLGLLSRFRKPADNALLLTQHQGGRLRQVFIRCGHVISARLSRIEPSDDDEFGASLISEIMQSRKYLERSRQLSPIDPLDVYFIADESTAARAFADNSRIEFQAHIIDPQEAMQGLGMSAELRPGHMEALYLACCMRKRPAHDYALRHSTDYSKLVRIRTALTAVAVTAAIACSVASGMLLIGALMFRDASQALELQNARMEETYRRENAEFEPIRADSSEMKLAVDTGEFFLRNSLPVEWVMVEVGAVMDRHADMHIDELRWQIETTEAADDGKATGSRRDAGGRPLPVAVPQIAAITASLRGEIRPYDGDLRDAFARIDDLADDLRRRTAFATVAVAEYPIDARPAASLSGEVRRSGDTPSAQFSINMRLGIDNGGGSR